MAQLDRFLNLLVSNKGTALVMSEGDLDTVTIKDSPRAVMKQPLTSAQILTLVREVAPANQSHALDAKGSMRFEYSCSEGTFDLSLTQNGKIAVRIEPKTRAVAAAAAAAAPAAAVQSVRGGTTSNATLDRIENLLRTLVGNKASDLHLRAGSPPMLRATGEIAPMPGQAALSSDEIDA